ncbi:MAG TPA: hypothetical protein VFM24_06085 [Nitrospira sp.]|jgi:hypothetical protein|nr:hypothetical protein [Nitrospira sp.]
MKWLAGAALAAILTVQPAWAAGPEFDPEQPFKGAGQRLLESVLGQALAALDEHFEVSGSLDSDAKQNNDGKKTLRFRFYPNGKSKSNDHIAAEGSFGPSTDPSQDEFHFRFTVPKSLTEPSAVFPENVL